MNKNSVRVSLLFPCQMFERVSEHLDKTGLTLSEFLRRAVDHYLNGKE